MPPNEDETGYEVCFTVSPDKRTDRITRVKPDHLFYGSSSADVVFRVNAADEEDAEDKACKILTDPDGPYIKKFGRGLEIKKKYIWHIY